MIAILRWIAKLATDPAYVKIAMEMARKSARLAMGMVNVQIVMDADTGDVQNVVVLACVAVAKGQEM